MAFNCWILFSLNVPKVHINIDMAYNTNLIAYVNIQSPNMIINLTNREITV